MHDAAKTNVAGRRVNRLTLPRCRPIAQAVIGRAEMGTAFHHPASDTIAGLARQATGFFEVFGARRRREGGRGPLPYIADHVVEPVAVCGKGIDWRGALVAIELEVLPGKPALPNVGHDPPLR